MICDEEMNAGTKRILPTTLNAVNQLKELATVPIPGTHSIKRLKENVGATQVKLSPKELKAILEIIPHGSAGSRYPAEVLEIFTRD